MMTSMILSQFTITSTASILTTTKMVLSPDIVITTLNTRRLLMSTHTAILMNTRDTTTVTMTISCSETA